jgi:hypothetical protein
MAAMAQQFMVLQFDAGRPEFNDYISGIYEGPCTVDPNHDLTLVGYGKDPEGSEFWIANNSGEGRGRMCLLDEGYFVTTMGHVWSHCFACLCYRLVQDPLLSTL